MMKTVKTQDKKQNNEYIKMEQCKSCVASKINWCK